MIDLYRNDNQVIIDAFDRIVVDIFMEKQQNQRKSFVICGCNPGAGTTSTSVELAISLSVSGWRTVLVDADLRKDGRYKRLNQKAEAGLSDYIVKGCPAETICLSTNWQGLDYIACGKSLEETPVKLLCSVRMGELLEYLNQSYDFIIFDVPSLNSAVDAKIMGAKADCTFLVVEAGETTFKNLSEAQKNLEEVGANVAGVIVNKVSLEEYEKVVRDYNYFHDKVFMSRNRYYGTGKEAEKKGLLSRLVSRAGKRIGCLVLAAALGVLPVGLSAQAAGVPEAGIFALSPGSTGVLQTEAALAAQEDNSMLPILMATGYEVTEGTVAAGSRFTLQIRFQNVNRYVSAHQVYITIYSQTEGVYLQNGETNQRYLEYVGAGESGSVSVDMAVSDAVQADSALLEVRFDYVNASGKGGSNTTSMSPDIRKSCRVEILSLTASENATVGSRALFNIRYANSGETPVKNLRMRLEGSVENADKEISLEIPEPGRQKYLDKYVVFTEPGNQRLAVYLTYEDEDGNAYELEPQRVSVLVRRKQTAGSGETAGGKNTDAGAEPSGGTAGAGNSDGTSDGAAAGKTGGISGDAGEENSGEVVSAAASVTVESRLEPLRARLAEMGVELSVRQMKYGVAAIAGAAAFLAFLALILTAGKRRRGKKGRFCFISLKEPKKEGTEHGASKNHRD